MLTDGAGPTVLVMLAGNPIIESSLRVGIRIIIGGGIFFNFHR